MNFLVRFKKAIVNFEEYQSFGTEKLSIAIKYFIKLILVFALVASIALTYKIYTIANNIAKEIQAVDSDFRFENGELTIEAEKLELQKDNYYFNIIADDTRTDAIRDK